MKFYFEPGTSIQPALIHAGDKARGLYISVADAGAQQLVDWLNTVAGEEQDMLVEAITPLIDAASNLYRQIESAEELACRYQGELRALKVSLFDAKQAKALVRGEGCRCA